jgi:hypothetical protein
MNSVLTHEMDLNYGAVLCVIAAYLALMVVFLGSI